MTGKQAEAMDPKAACGVGETARKDELSEGELMEEDSSPSSHSNGQDTVSDPGEAKPQHMDEIKDKADTDCPQAKRPRVEDTGCQDTEGGWEQRQHQVLEDKYVATATPSEGGHLHARQRDVVDALATIACGDGKWGKFDIQRLKTVQFQDIVLHLATGHPALGVVKTELDERWKDYRTVVVWLSMISSEFARRPERFTKLKQLTPSVTFEIKHPGSSTRVKPSLESFIMRKEDSSSSQSNTFEPNDPNEKVPDRYSYLFSLNDLTDNNFPNLSSGAVDQLGRDIGSYIGIVEWPSGEVKAAPEVVCAVEASDDRKEMLLFAIDCEMVQTSAGSEMGSDIGELGRVSVVNEDLVCVYDTYVKPASEVTDYRTRFSGLTAEILDGVETTLKDVQDKILSLLPPNAILIGHSLENDFHAMQFRHPFVIDTSLIFTPNATPTHKPGLRRLCEDLLTSSIQNSDKGHDSIEDATACMELVKLKLQKGTNCKVLFNEITTSKSPSIFTDCRLRECSTGMVDKVSVVRQFGKGCNFSAEVMTGAEAVEKSIEIIPQCKFTFVQLHSMMEYLLESGSGEDEEKVLEVADSLDSQVSLEMNLSLSLPPSSPFPLPPSYSLPSLPIYVPLSLLSLPPSVPFPSPLPPLYRTSSLDSLPSLPPSPPSLPSLPPLPSPPSLPPSLPPSPPSPLPPSLPPHSHPIDIKMM